MYNHFITPIQPRQTSKKKKKGSVVKPVKEESYVDEKITDPQFGICRYSLKDPEGKNQIAEWGEVSRISKCKSIFNVTFKAAQNQIAINCSEVSSIPSVTSTLIVSPSYKAVKE